MKTDKKSKRKYTTPKLVESQIEEQILFFLESQDVSVEKVSSEWYYNEKKGFYQKRKSRYSRSGTSDIHGTIKPNGRWLFIEVKTPDTIKDFDRPVVELAERLVEARYDKKLSKASIQRYQHALDQAKYIEEKIMAWAIAFYADSTDMVIQKLQSFWITITP